MFIRLVIVDSTFQPDHLFSPKVSTELLPDLVLCELRISSSAQEARCRHKNRPLSVRMDRTAFQNEGVGLVAVIAKLPTDFFRHKIVLLPVGVKSVHGSSPGVELPVDATDSALPVHHKGRCHIPRPGIVGLHPDHVDPVSRIPG